MNTPVKSKTPFQEWFTSLVGFKTNEDRFNELIEDISGYVGTVDATNLKMWLEIAFNNGYEQGHADATPEE